MRRLTHSTAILVLVLLWIWDPVYSQLPIRVGADAGINFANQSLSHNPYGKTITSRLGFFIGGLAEIGITDIWYIQAEPRYIQKGMKVPDAFVITGPNGPEPIGTADLAYKLVYLEIPLLFKAKFGTTDIKPFVFGGPNIGFLLSAKYEELGKVGSQSQETIVSSDVKDSFKSVDLSLDLGGGAEYQISQSVSLIVNARYSLGLNNVNTTSSSPGNTIKSYGIQIAVGALFTL